MNKKLLKKEVMQLLNDKGELVYYFHDCTPKVRINGNEFVVDKRAYLGLLSSGITPTIIDPYWPRMVKE